MPGQSEQDTSVEIRFYDFDHTLTKKHSYRPFALRTHNAVGTVTHLDEQYELGKMIAGPPHFWAKGNLRDILHHDTNNLSCIATFHNNPSFIAGFLATHFNRELHYKETLFNETKSLAIAVYYLEDVKRPLLISYIPAVGAVFDAIAKPLQTCEGKEFGKNPQLAHLKEVIAQRQLVTDWPDTIHFYDDSALNVKNASLLPDLTVYKVSTLVTDRLVYERFSPGIQASSVASSSNQPAPCHAAPSNSVAQGSRMRFFVEEVPDDEGMAPERPRRNTI